MAVVGKRFEFELDNGNKFYIRRYDPFLALEILGEVQKKFLPSIAAFFEARDNTDRDAGMDAAMKAVETISKNLDGKSLIALVKTVLNPDYVSVSIGSDPPIRLDEGTINLACDDVSDTLMLVIEVLRYNYEKLFTQSRNLFGMVQSPAVENQ